jgi:hypothetical protein
MKKVVVLKGWRFSFKGWTRLLLYLGRIHGGNGILNILQFLINKK